MESSKCPCDVPNEVLMEIFSYMSIEDLVHNVSCVCSQWKEVSQDPLLWRDRIYNPDCKQSDSNIAWILQQIPKLQSLILDRPVQSVVLNAFIQHCQNLKMLELNHGQKLSVRLLKKILENYPKMVHLTMPSVVLSDLKLAEIIGQFSNLKTLIVSGWSFDENPIYLKLKPIADGCPALQHIDIRGKLVASDDLEYFLEKKKDQLLTLCVKWESADMKCTLGLLTKCNVLKTLHLDSYTEIDIEKGFQALSKLTTVVSLTFFVLYKADINYVIDVFSEKKLCHLTELRIRYFYSYEDELAEVIINNCPQLKLLCIEQCPNVTDRSVKNMHCLLKLQNLNLSGSAISDVGMLYLKECKNLEFLCLRYCMNLRKEGMKLIPHFVHLRILKLDYCDIQGLPLLFLSNEMKSLQQVSIKFCRNVDKKALAQLQTEKPHLIAYEEVDLSLRTTVREQCEVDNEVLDDICFLFYQPQEPSS